MQQPGLLDTLLRSMTAVEWVAALTTLLNVYLVIRNNIWSWFWGLLAVLLYGYVFWTGKLYSSMLLQLVFYLPMQGVGYWVWLRGGPRKSDDLPIGSLAPLPRFLWLAVNIPLTFALGWAMGFTGAQMTYADAFVTALSVTGQILLTRKYVENWWLWIVVDVVYAFYLLPTQKLYVSAGLYAVLLVMAVFGLREWTRLKHAQEAGSGATTAEPLPVPLPPGAVAGEKGRAE